jgi:hypothetical protein
MEFKKFETKGLEGSALEFANSANALIDGLSAMEGKSVTAEELEKKMTEIKELIPTDAKDEIKLEMKNLETDLLKRINEIKSKPMEQKMVSLEQGILEALQTLDVKSAVEAKSKLKGKMVDLEVKDAIVTSSYSGDVSRTQIIGLPKFAPINANAFFGVPGITTGSVDNGKSILMWIPSSYTSNVGYVEEITAQSNADAASATEKSRKMAKIAAKMQMSAEMFEDLPQFASRLAEQMRRKAELFIDNKILDGEGNDSTKPNEIYGIVGQGSTAFSATPFALAYDNATILDLLDACATQAQLANYKVNTVRMNPVDASLLRRVKDANGQPIVQTLVDGTPTIGGLRLITTNKLTKNTMLVSDDSLIQIWTKRGMEMKVGQYSTDAEKDQYTTLMFARVQCLVEDSDKAGVIYVSSISDSISAINKTVVGG